MSSGRVLVIKIKYQDDVRRISFREMPTFKKVKNTLQKLFTYLSLSDFVIKYVDEESDLVTVSSDMELHEAISQSDKLLRLYLVESSRAPGITASSLGVSTLDPNAAINAPVIHASTLMRMPTLAATKPKASGPSFGLPQLGGNTLPPFQGSNPAVSDVLMQLATTNPQLARQLMENANKAASKKNNPETDQPPIPTLPEPQVEIPQVQEPVLEPTCVEPIEPAPAPEPEVSAPTTSKKKKNDIRYLARFVKNVTIPDATEISTGQSFTKIWEMRNDGEHPWPAGTKLGFVGGDALATVDNKEIEEEVNAGESIEIAVPMTTPAEPGRYVSYWRLVTPSGNRFGHRVWVDVLVVAGKADSAEEPEEPIPEPTPEPVAPTAEPSAPTEEQPAEVPAVSGPATPPASGATKDALRVLADMGFTNTELCTALLYRNNNNLMVTIQDLLQGKYKQ